MCALFVCIQLNKFGKTIEVKEANGQRKEKTSKQAINNIIKEKSKEERSSSMLLQVVS